MSCPVCESAFKKYGFTLKDGLKCYTASDRACCPKKCTITFFNTRVVKYTTEDGEAHSKPFLDFMKSSWVDRTEF